MPEQSFSIRDFPAWAGSNFVSKLHREVPPNLDPRQHTLPSPFVAVITGASRGIGAAIAKSFAQAGATGLVLTARNAASLAETKRECEAVAKAPHITFSLVSADNAQESSAEQVARTVRAEHGGRVDVLVNNAGILATNATAFGKVADIDSSQLEIPTHVNYLGRFYMIKHLLPLMLAAPPPEGAATATAKTIVNVSSIGSHVSGPLGFSISALATNRLSQRVAEAYADQGVFCCAIHPGAVRNDDEQTKALIPEALMAASLDSPYLCGAMILWLLRERREWLNGRYLDATWDVEELEKKKDEIVQGDKLKMRLVV